MEEVNIRFSIDNESEFGQMLHDVTKVFSRLLASSEKKRNDLINEYTKLKGKFDEIQSADQLKEICSRYEIKTGGKTFTDAVEAIGKRLDELTQYKINTITALEEREKELAAAFFVSKNNGNSSDSSWNELIQAITQMREKDNNIEQSVANIYCEVKKDGDLAVSDIGGKLDAIKDWIHEMQDEEKRNEAIISEIRKCLFTDEENQDWNSCVYAIKQLKATEVANKTKNEAWDSNVDRMIHERFDEIQSLVESDINNLGNEDLKDYLQRYIDENERWKKEKDAIMREFKQIELLPTLCNIIWWNEQEELTPFLSDISSLKKISNLLNEIVLLSEIKGYKILIPKGKMLDEFEGYRDESLMPDTYKKIFKDVNYPQDGYMCMISVVAITKLDSPDKGNGKCYRFH